MKVKNQYFSEKCALYNGDSCEILTGFDDECIDYMIFSPPFEDLYTYSDSERDLGNCKTSDEFYEHFQFIVKELYRILKSGRLVSIHCMDLPTAKYKDGFIGLKDFPGELIRIFQDAGFIYHSRVTIWKDPVVAMQRTKALGLLHKQIKKDSCMSRQGIADYVITMRKNGENKEPVSHTNESFPVERWQRYASPVWMDINQSNTLQKISARDDRDEKHICLAEGTLVLTKRGYIPIEDVIEMKDETLTHTGEWKRITAKAKTKINADVVQVNAIGVPNLVCTPDHKVLSIYGNDKKKANSNKNNLSWTESENLKNHYLVEKMPKEVKSDISKQEWWIIGRWLADGHMDYRHHQFFISVGKNKTDLFEKMAIGHIGAKNKNGNCTQYEMIELSKKCREILLKCGNNAESKVIPYEAISLNKELSESFLSGYLSGDGHTTKNGHIMCTSVSRSLLLGISIVFRKARGLSCSIYKGRSERKRVIGNRTVNCKQEWVLTASPNYSFNIVDSENEYKKVKSINKAESRDVWSIRVEDDESFTAEGCIVKNCPLQLDVIERCIELWSNVGDTILTPFMGIGSECYQAIKMNRKAIGIELKESYFNQSVKNVQSAEMANEQLSLFGEVDNDE